MRLKVCTGCGNLFEQSGRSRRCPECSTPDPRWSREYKRAKAARIRFVEIDRGRLECEGCTAYLVPLQAHHVDGQRWHHAIDNLRMLCSTCHQAATDKLAGRPTFASPSEPGPSAPRWKQPMPITKGDKDHRTATRLA